MLKDLSRSIEASIFFKLSQFRKLSRIVFASKIIIMIKEIKVKRLKGTLIIEIISFRFHQ